MEDPKQEPLPPRAKNGNKSRNKAENGRANNSQSQPSSPNPDPDSSPQSTISANRNGSDAMHSQNHLADSETISNASRESSKSSRRRRRARGGRKGKSKLHIASQQQQHEASVPDAPGDGNQAGLQFLDAEKELYGDGDGLPDPCAAEQDEGERFEEDARPFENQGRPEYRQQEEQGEQPPKTGIRAFSARRADPNGRRPVGTKVQRNSKKTATQDHNDREGQSEQQSSERQDSSKQGRMPRISVKRTGPGQEDGKQTGEEQQQEKEVSIKFDLNLEIELALRTKVKGEVMVTFL